MSFPAEDGVGSLCHKALQIISELCLGGQVEREKCAGIFPLETARQGIGGTGTAPVPPPLPSCRRRGRPESATFSFAFPACRGGGWGGIRGGRLAARFKILSLPQPTAAFDAWAAESGELQCYGGFAPRRPFFLISSAALRGAPLRAGGPRAPGTVQ